MDEPKKGFFAKVYYSAAGFDNYRHFIMQKTGKAVVYLLLLSLILSFVGLIQPVMELNAVVNEMIYGFDKAVPDFVLDNGKLSVDGPMPIITSQGGASTLIIDTSGGTDESILDNYDNAILITQDRMIQKSFANKQVTDFSMLQGVRIDKAGVGRMLPVLKTLTIFVIILLPPFIIAGRFLSALFVSIIGMIINSSRRVNLPYRDVFSISVYALTVPLILGTLLDLAGVPFLWSTLIFYLIAAIYVWGAINSIKQQSDFIQIPPMD